ncbi:hypothetical protein [Magnetospirillum fulvum]|uniref:Nudix hydrolase domain-containing protein n=1 Tax=Magnetospirillum fulvum TaxID=1082 RepID=A0A1H6IEA3_MAGFU|nr:hypothetical protein [Magnetospirillum fulvum]SEH46195.1 hypothetical protein SAMN04244559_02464 [Magnetospirillum fulvum]
MDDFASPAAKKLIEIVVASAAKSIMGIAELAIDRISGRFIPVKPSHMMEMMNKIKDDVNKIFIGHSSIEIILRKYPILENEGDLTLSDKELEKRIIFKNLIDIEKRPNETHAIVSDDSFFYGDSPIIKYRTVDYAGIRAIRSLGGKPKILSAGGFFVCLDQKKIAFHQRSKFVDTYKDCLHIFGGNFMKMGHVADSSILHTLLREFEEEARVSLRVSRGGDNPIPFLFANEVTGFVQFVAPPFNIDAADFDAMSGDGGDGGITEGGVRKINFSELSAILQDVNKWVPSGLMHVIVWLAIGTPVIHKHRIYRAIPEDQSIEIFKQVVVSAERGNFANY